MEKPQREYSDVRIQVPWGFIAGRWYGEKKLKPILALHGWLDNLGTFDRLIPLMPRHVDVLSIDFPGHGLSSKMPKGTLYSHTNYVLIILYLMSKYDWDKVSLLAHSMGSVVSFVFTSLYPERVDMLISLDIIVPRYYEPNSEIAIIYKNIERNVIEDERLNAAIEPPVYTFDELKQLLYAGSGHSVELEFCKLLLNRNISKSSKYPEKYYFSRDARVKNLFEFNFSPEISADMAKAIHPIPYLVIKGSDSSYIDESSNEVISVLKKNNPLFEFHEIPGRHHLHLNNPEEVSAVLNRFINRHRPPKIANFSLESMSEQVSWNEEQKGKSARSKL